MTTPAMRGAAPPEGGSSASKSVKTFHFKLVLLGDASVGKSCLITRFGKNEFYEYHEPTIGAAFMTQSVQVGGSIVRFEIWDTAGAERYRALAPLYYRGAAAGVIVYDITKKDSFDGAKIWVNELRNFGSPDILIALAGNKADLESHRAIPTQVASDYAEANQLLFYETSAKTGQNVFELFKNIATKLPKHPKEQTKKKDDAATGFQLADVNNAASHPDSVWQSLWSCCKTS